MGLPGCFEILTTAHMLVVEKGKANEKALVWKIQMDKKDSPNRDSVWRAGDLRCVRNKPVYEILGK